MIVHIKETNKPTNKVYKQELKRAGFRWKRTGKYTGDWSKNVPDKDLERTQHWCEARGFRYLPEDPNYSRVKGYREIYFDSHKPVIKGKYICAYCGKIMPREMVVVDHIYPVSAVKEPKNKLNRFIMNKVFRITNINDSKNLTSSCDRCNKKKSSKTGLFWILRGKLGKNLWYWVIIYGVMFAIIAFVVYTLLNKMFGI